MDRWSRAQKRRKQWQRTAENNQGGKGEKREQRTEGGEEGGGSMQSKGKEREEGCTGQKIN
eukprot:12414818-Karenia_brevis.AAC.1